MRQQIADLLSRLREADETADIEAKSGNGAGVSAHQTVCAFANAPDFGGGYILFGVERAGEERRYVVTGVSDPDKLQADLASQLRSVLNHPPRTKLWCEAVEGKPVVALFVAEAEPSQKPVYIKKMGLPSGAYRRRGSGDDKGTDDDLREYAELSSLTRYEDTLVPDATFDDFSPEAIATYRRLLRDSNPASEVLGWSDEDLMRGLGAVTKTPNGFQPTVAGMLLFGSQPSLRRFFPMLRVDYVRVEGTEWVADPDRRFSTLEIRAPLFVAFQRACAAIQEDLSKQFTLPADSLRREEVPTIPGRVIREVVANALLHRSYRRPDPTLIIRYSNRLEIRNPGYSLTDEEQLGQPTSRSRNPRLGSVFHDLELAENKGSGIATMRREMKRVNLSPPAFESSREGDSFAATLLFHHFLNDADWAWLARFKDLGLSNEQAQALVFARENGRIRNADVRQLSGLDTLAASQLLRQLRDAGLLEQNEHGTATYYTPTERLLGGEVEPPLAPSLRQGSAPLPQSSAALPQGSAALPQGSEPLSQGSAALPQGSDTPASARPFSREEWLQDLPEELRHRVEGLGQRSPAALLRELIVDLCAWRALAPFELASILKKEPTHIIRAYLSPLVKESRLERTHPENPSHPQQKYRVMRPVS